jgi:hypothetical protein
MRAHDFFAPEHHQVAISVAATELDVPGVAERLKLLVWAPVRRLAVRISQPWYSSQNPSLCVVTCVVFFVWFMLHARAVCSEWIELHTAAQQCAMNLARALALLLW